MWIDVENSNEKVYSVDKNGAEKVDKKEKKEPKKRIIYLLFKKFTFIRSFLTNECFTHKLILFHFACVARKGVVPRRDFGRFYRSRANKPKICTFYAEIRIKLAISREKISKKARIPPFMRKIA